MDKCIALLQAVFASKRQLLRLVFISCCCRCGKVMVAWQTAGWGVLHPCLSRLSPWSRAGKFPTAAAYAALAPETSERTSPLPLLPGEQAYPNRWAEKIDDEHIVPHGSSHISAREPPCVCRLEPTDNGTRRALASTRAFLRGTSRRCPPDHRNEDR